MERLLDYFKPERYQLELRIFSKEEYIQGVAKIDGEIADNKNVVKFHAVDMDIKAVDFEALHSDSHEESYDEKEKSVSNYEYEYNGEILEIPITDDMQAQLKKDNNNLLRAQFKITFETKLNHNMVGCYLSTYKFNGETQRLVATQFESHYAREAFPCIDEPTAKAIFDLTLIVPDLTTNDVVLANTPTIKQDSDRFEFEPTPRMSTYLLAWVIGPLKSISTTNNHGTKVTSYCALNQSTTSLKFANEVAARALEYYDDKFGIEYPLRKLDQVALPDFEAGAMENWGLVTYRESCMLAEPDASIDTKQSIASTITHELSHQWFGDLVTMKWWDELWLNESFASIMEYYATDALYPEFKVWQEFFTGDCVIALQRDCLPGVQAVQQEISDPDEISTLFDGAIVYAKGAHLMLMLIRLMGEENFYRGLRNYFQKYKYQNTIGDNLWDALQEQTDFDIKTIMHAWVSQPGYPALQEAHNGDQTWREQQRFLINGTTDDTKWPLPEVKDDMSGHYLLDLSTNEFDKKLEKYDELNLEQRLRLLIDRMLLAKAGLVASSALLDLLPKFIDEDAPVWDIMLSIINDLKIFFPTDSDEENNYRAYLRRIIHDRIRKIGVLPRGSDDSNEKRLRNILSVIARFSRDEEIIQQLADQYRDDLTQINSELRGNVLMAKMLLDEKNIFSEILTKYKTETDPEIKDDLLCTLASARDEADIDIMIKLLNDPQTVRPQDNRQLLIYLLRNPQAHQKALDWPYENWDYIQKTTGNKNIEYYPRAIANLVETRAEAEQFYRFFDKMKDEPTFKRTLEMARFGIEARLNLIKRESSDVQQKVKELTED